MLPTASTAIYTGLGAKQLFHGPSPELVEELARAYGKGEEFFVLGQRIFKGRAIVDYDVVIGKKSLGKMPAVFTAVYHDLIAIPVKFDIRLVNQLFLVHGALSEQYIE